VLAVQEIFSVSGDKNITFTAAYLFRLNGDSGSAGTHFLMHTFGCPENPFIPGD
jgi:hypothetical protein